MWPFKKPEPEKRGYSDLILAGLEANAMSQAAKVGQTAAIEAVAGLLARTLQGAMVQAPDYLRINPDWLGTIGRQLVRDGEHLSRIAMTDNGQVALVPAGHWYFVDSMSALESTWKANVTEYGPSGSTTRTVNRAGLVFVRWASFPIEPEHGRSPARLASLTAKAAAESERLLGDELGGPIAQILTVPNGQDGAELAAVQGGITKARGKAVMVETNQGGLGDMGTAPARDWVASRLGANPSQPVVEAADRAFSRMVAACGASVSLFTDADGTSQREALRRWHLSTVLPIIKLIEWELKNRIDPGITIKTDNYGLDIQARAAALDKLVKAGVSLDEARAFCGV